MLGVKDIEKYVSVEFDNDDALWTLESGYEKILGIKLLCKKINSSRVLNFSSANDTNRRGHGVLFQSFLEA